MRISDWSSDVCSSDLHTLRLQPATSRQRMIRSMTAFAAGERSTQWGTLGCEMRAVNHRFLELGVRLPDELRLLEPALRERVSARVSRGKVDLTLRLRAGEGGGRSEARRVGNECVGTCRSRGWP